MTQYWGRHGIQGGGGGGIVFVIQKRGEEWWHDIREDTVYGGQNCFFTVLYTTTKLGYNGSIFKIPIDRQFVFLTNPGEHYT